MPTLVSVFGVEPQRIGGTEMFARELSVQIGERGWHSVLCFLSEPTPEVRAFLNLPNTSIEAHAKPTDGTWDIGRSLARIMRRYHPDIVHLHFVGFINPYFWLAKLHSVDKVFFTDHHSRPGGAIVSRAPWWKRTAARFVNAPLNKVFCVSNYGYQCMTSTDLFPRDRFEMIYNGVDLARVTTDGQQAARFRERYSIPADRSIVTQVSWVIPEKGIADFLTTAQLVTAVNRRVQFVLVGEGEQRDAYMKQAVAMGLGDHITFTGMVEDPFGAGVFHAADIVCQFSRWEEVFGWMIAEAMAHGKPVVATRVGGIPELISDGVSGYLVDRGDTASMSQRVLQLLDDQKLCASAGVSASATVTAKFNLKTNVEHLLAAYGMAQQTA
jgi:glycosyltransferase involved in cell wall biosynthesis